MAVSKYCSACDRSFDACTDKIGHGGAVRFKVSIYVDNKRRRQKGFNTKTEAKKWEAEQLAGANPRGTAESLMFDTFLDLYWANYCSVRMKDGGKSEKERHRRIKRYFEGLKLRQLSLSAVEQFITKRLAEGKTVATVNREITTLKCASKWAYERNYLGIHPLQRLKKLKGDAIRVRWLSDVEIEALLQYSDELMTNIILFSLNTGFRLSNIKRVKVEDINVENGWITARKTKSGNPYDVPILPAFAPHLKTIIGGRGSGLVFPPMMLARKFMRVVKAVGLNPNGPADPERVTFHTLRHTYAAQLLKQGVDIYTVSKWMGHSSVTITEKVYGHLCKQYQLGQTKNIQIGGNFGHSLGTLEASSEKAFLENQ